MAKPLIIVESPTKAKTITRLLKGRYEVLASQGHVRDLPKRGLSIEITPEKVFIPRYELLPTKQAILNQLKRAVHQASEVWLATDEDREGEAIAWHICEALKLDKDKPLRITFHEITERALKEALARPRAIAMSLVNAQQARRLLDRIVGYELSPLLWRAFPAAKGPSKKPSALSAGRVQSAALRLIVERERAIQQHQPNYSIEAQILLQTPTPLWAKLHKPTFDNLQTAQKALMALLGRRLRLKSRQQKQHAERPQPPFTTSTLQQEAQRRLGFSISRTMRTAQALYEKGLITYMRTDSTHLAPEARPAIYAVIQHLFGEAYLEPHDYSQKKAQFAQEAHEAIRPTDPNLETAGDTPDEEKLYHLIWSRTLASQMKPALYEKTRLTFEPEPPTDPLLTFLAEGEVLLFEGYLKAYRATPNELKETLPPLQENALYEWTLLELQEKFTPPPLRYTEGTLVRELEERGIGRPSTYVPTLETLFKRSYVRRGTIQTPLPPYQLIRIKPNGEITTQTVSPPPREEKNKLIPTDLGILVTQFLLEHFPEIVDYDFTSQVEHELDLIAANQVDWQTVLRKFYEQFAPKVAQTPLQTKNLRQRLLGYDPVSSRPVYACYGKHGPYLQLGENTDPDVRRAALPAGKRLDTITLEEALTLLSFPRELGLYQNKPVELRYGPYGFYLKYDGKNYKLPPTLKPYSLSLEEAITILTQPETGNTLKSFPEAGIVVRNGRYGPYFTYQGQNYSLKGIDLATLTPERCLEIVAQKSASAPKSTAARLPKQAAKRGD